MKHRDLAVRILPLHRNSAAIVANVKRECFENNHYCDDPRKTGPVVIRKCEVCGEKFGMPLPSNKKEQTAKLPGQSDTFNFSVRESVIIAGVIDRNNPGSLNLTTRFGGWKRDWIVQRLKIRHGDKANIIV